LVDEVKLKITKDKVTLKAVDPAHVAMVDLELKSSAFDEYSATDCELGIDIDKLKDVLKVSKPGDVVTLKHDDGKNMLIVQLQNITRKMSLVDTAGMTDPKVPNLNLPVKVVIKTSELLQGIKAAESISDHIALVASPTEFEMKCEGDTDSMSLRLPKEMLESLEAGSTVRSLFSLEYFGNMVKSIGSAEKVLLKLASDYPIMMEYDIANNEGHVKYLLAPRIENE
ncbi:MAG: proliferating cell nuclear antigen (pcna), partial [Thermoplasmata archaeon]